jgi:hypothetical protein
MLHTTCFQRTQKQPARTLQAHIANDLAHHDNLRMTSHSGVVTRRAPPTHLPRPASDPPMDTQCVSAFRFICQNQPHVKWIHNGAQLSTLARNQPTRLGSTLHGAPALSRVRIARTRPPHTTGTTHIYCVRCLQDQPPSPYLYRTTTTTDTSNTTSFAHLLMSNILGHPIGTLQHEPHRFASAPASGHILQTQHS